MSKELEALERIKKWFPFKVNELEYQDICIIESALKDYEILKERTKLDSFECLLRLEEILPRGKELLVPVAKQLKALEIIKEKLLYIDFKTLIASTDYVIYCFMVGNKNLTEKEYDLLKDVLL